MGFLDKTGLAYLWNKISSTFARKSEIPTIPSSLPANGGNADTVDGYHIRKVTNTSDTGQTGSITFIV